MNHQRRQFCQVLAIAAAGGMVLDQRAALANPQAHQLYDLPRFGNVHFLHFTDCHAQLMPIYLREPDLAFGIGSNATQAPYLTGEALLRHAGVKPGTAQAHAFTHLNFEQAAQTWGKVGGFAHLATLVARLRDSRPNALLLDGGDTWQGSATALWSKGQDMVEASLQLGTNIMTAHWEMTLGERRVLEIVQKDFKNKIAFVAQNIQTADSGAPVFEPFVLREMNGVKVAIIGQAYPHTSIAHPRHLLPNWRFGLQEKNLQITVDTARQQGAKVVVLLSHNGMDIDLKMASRIRGMDAILGGHTHDAVPVPVLVANPGGKTIVTNGGSHGKFLGVLDFDVKNGQIADFRYRLLPVFANFLPADSAMNALIRHHRTPHLEKLQEVLATTEGGLYRRGSFNGTFDQVILDALLAVKGAEIAFSPGFRWGTSLLPGADITMEQVMDLTAISYPNTTLNEMSGSAIKTVLEDVADTLFNPDPYYRQGEDMVRIGGLQYSISPNARIGQRITDLRLNGKPLEAGKRYKVAGWAPVAQGATGQPVWEVVAEWLRVQKSVAAKLPNQPKIIGMDGNPGMPT